MKVRRPRPTSLPLCYAINGNASGHVLVLETRRLICGYRIYKLNDMVMRIKPITVKDQFTLSNFISEMILVILGLDDVSVI